MASGRCSTSGYDGRYYYVDWSSSQDIANNRSLVSWTLGCAGGNSSWYAERTLSVSVAGSSVYSKSDRVSRYAGTIASGSLYVGHNSDGTGSFSITIQAAVYTSSVNCTGSGTYGLDQIARTSTFWLNRYEGILGQDEFQVNINRASSSFTHSICYRFGSIEWWGGTNVGTYFAFTPSINDATQIPSAVNGVGSIQVDTYYGSTYIGSNWCQITLHVPGSMAPWLADAWVSETNGWGIFVQGKSGISCGITPYGVYGSWIVSEWWEIHGQTYSGRTATTGAINYWDYVGLKYTAVDSRGRSVIWEYWVLYRAYSPPSVTGTSAWRHNAGCLCVSFNASITSLDGVNNKWIAVLYRKSGAQGWTTGWEVGNYSHSGTVYLDFGLSGDYAWEIMTYASDTWTNNSCTVVVSPDFVLMDFLAGGRGLSIGQTATKEGLNIGTNIYYQGGSFAPYTRTYIPNYQNLNDFLTVGDYYNSQDADVSGMANIPIKNAFYMEVRCWNHNGIPTSPPSVIQRFFVYYGSTFWIRCYKQWCSEWTPWYQYDCHSQVSSERFKEEIQDLEAQEIFDSLNPVSFKYNNELLTDTKTHFGFIVEDLERGLDNSKYNKDDCAIYDVRKGQEDSYKALSYTEIIAINTSMIKKLQKRCNELEAKIIELEGQVINEDETKPEDL